MARVTLTERVAALAAQVESLTAALTAAQAASPSVAVNADPAPNSFIAFLGERHAAAIAAGTHVACEVPGCKGIMNAARTTTITVGKRKVRACKRHFRRG